MAQDLHDLEVDVRKTIADYVELQREVVEQMTGTESVAQSVSDAVAKAIIAIRSPIHGNVCEATSHLRGLPEEFVEPALELFTARTLEVLLPDLVRLEDRLEDVLRLANDATPSQRAGTALSKIVRCYLLGLDAETIAMCRAALDVAVSDALATSDPKALSRRGTLEPMAKKLKVLCAQGRLSDPHERDAMEVWRQGNEVLHSNTDDVESAPVIVAKTLWVIAALFPKSPGEDAVASDCCS